MKRITSIDITRGIVMIIMALDHVRDLMHSPSLSQSPTDLTNTTPLLFFTRWITYVCAPVFVFLAGTSVYISLHSKNEFSQIRRHVILRGIWLIIIDFTLLNFALYFDPGFHSLLFEVLATIGFGFIVLGLMLKLPIKLIGIIGLAILFSHNLISLIPFAENSFTKSLVMPFFSPGAIPLGDERFFIIAYPPFPWLGILLFGFACGQFFKLPDDRRKKIFLKIGLISVLLFIALRLINVYGDPVPWSVQKDGMFTFLSFMNVTKYPPSLLFGLITLGLMFFMLAFADYLNGTVKKILTVYGRVPLFYFLLHFYLIHLLLLVMLFMQGFSWSQFAFSTGTFGRPPNVESGVSLQIIYILWIGVVIIMYKPCVWYGKYKADKNRWWLSYF